MTKLLLIIGNDETQSKDQIQWEKFNRILHTAGHNSILMNDGGEALDFVLKDNAETVGLVLLHMDFPDMEAMSILSQFQEKFPDLPVIILTEKASVNMAVEAMRDGAYDFMVKPVDENRLIKAIDRALTCQRQKTRQKTNQKIRENKVGHGGQNDDGFAALIGQSPMIKNAVAMAKKAAASNVPILLEGESGVGKEVFARAIQQSSDRRNRPFIVVNCGALPVNLVESILFGHEKGAFTGATDQHDGKFLEADGGTLFLDEIGELPLDIQVKLLRILQEGEVEPVGGRQCIKVDVRLISATNKNLQTLVKKGEFREDLMYRLNIFPIELPPLRKRQEDVALLAENFVRKICLAEGLAPKEISPAAMSLLMSYRWPGNVRQLENTISRAVILSESQRIEVEDFPQIHPGLENSSPAFALGPENGGSAGTPMWAMTTQDGHIRRICDVEAEMIHFSLNKYESCMSDIARRLGIGRSTLYRKVAEYKLGDESASGDPNKPPVT